ncbi:MAG: AMP-binding protein [Acidobacteria bacterium]|nr:AMP-binding protein [Acidobacteriota bacterium]
MSERTLSLIIEDFFRYGDDTAFVQRRGYRMQRWSYRQVADSARRFARELEARDVHRGDRVFLWGENCAEWAVAFFGSVLRGATLVPMDRTASREFASRVYRQVNARLCVCPDSMPPPGPGIPKVPLENLQEILQARSGAPLAMPSVRPGDAVEIVFTSGTTDDPKGVVLSHKNILSNLDPLEKEINKYLKYERIVHPLRFLNLLPLSHVFGQYLGLFIPRIFGGTVIFENSLRPADILRAIRRERVSVLVAVPKILQALRDKVEWDLESEGALPRFQRRFEKAGNRHFLRRWWIFRRLHREFGWKFWAIVCGGARLDEETEKFWGRLGFALVQGYGLTETSSMVSLNHPLKISRGTIGKALPGREIRLAPDGEILVRGESVADGYLRGEETTPVRDRDGWFATGDLGVLDDEGNLHFKGRRKNVIVTAEGLNIYPEDLEAALLRQPEVRDCVVAGIERQGNPEVCAVLLLRDTKLQPQPVIRRVNESLSDYQHIRHWYVWPDGDFPRTPTRKPQLGIIRDFAASKLREAAQKSSEGKPYGGILAELIRQVTGRRIETLQPDSRLSSDLDLSSIERVQLLGALEDRFQMDLNESSFTEASTVGDLEAMLQSPSSAVPDYGYPRWTQRKPVALLRNFTFYLLTFPAISLLARPLVRGRERLDGLRAPFLFVSNHITRADAAFVLAALPPRFRHRLAVAMRGELLQEMRHPDPDTRFWKRWLSIIEYGLVTALFNVFPLPQKSGFRGSFNFAGESLDRGYSVLVFPEGGRTRDGKLQPFQAGIGLLATNLNVAVVPVRIDGLYALKKAGKKFPRPGTVTVNIGTAVSYKSGMDPADIARDLALKVASL